MRLRNIPGADNVIAESPYVVKKPNELKGKWREFLGNNHPIYIEVGMGKGKFITTLASKNRDINYIGIEMYTSVLLRAVQKLDEQELMLDNLRFICMDARLLEDVFDKDEIDKIYLNFSDPWPKDRHSKRRLPSIQFLDRYDKILKPEGSVEFKTDNKDLFDFAVDEVNNSKWKIDEITYNLHADTKMMQNNVMTEYEEKFSAIGNLIHKYIISRSK